ncbi:ComEC/Rec2 family competence protein [Pseudomonas nicosulfuronedens]
MANNPVFAGSTSVFILDAQDGKPIQQLLWGDEIVVLQDHGDWLEVEARRERGWLQRSKTTPERLLEINFVDVGQGDGAFIVTPDNELALVDAGAGSNMLRFLSWRFNLRIGRPSSDPKKVDFKFAVMSHGDEDHYGGFTELFESPHLSFERIYHNTLVQRKTASAADGLGERGQIQGTRCHMELIRTPDDLARLLAAHPDDRSKYLQLLKAAGPERTQGITEKDAYLPGFEADHRTAGGKSLSIEILGPIALEEGGQLGLPQLGDSIGISKNGHSIVLLVRYGQLRFLLGGDLNTPAETYLLRQKTKRDAPPENATANEWADYLAIAREHFGADVAKSCHHGSADFSTTFLRAINAAATVISSGDEEPHCHPRPDTLGAVGKHSRGERPCIFSTELMRSSPEFKARSQYSGEQIRQLLNELPGAGEKRRKQILKEVETLLSAKERVVATYGMITLRTDGERVLMAQKLERPRAGGVEFDMHWFSRREKILTLDQ